MVRRKKTGKTPVRKCPECGDPMVDLDYCCRKCGYVMSPEIPPSIPDYGTPE